MRRERRPAIETIFAEKGGRLTIPLDDGSSFDLTAKADRIEFLKDGTAVVVDYKTRRAAVGQGSARRLVAATDA